MQQSPMNYRGFSLVELSIVLVILGLLVGGVLSGQSLIRAAELRAATSEYSRYVTAVQSFRDKYFALPGDMNNATRFWGNLGGTNCVNNAGTAAVTTGTCDGNGNGIINNPAAAAGQTSEGYQFWRQLAFAGLIEGTYTGIAGAGGQEDAILGTNVPRSKLNNGGWSAWNSTIGAFGDTQTYFMDYGNMFELGSKAAGSRTFRSLFKPEELWNIDTKTDDGRPGTGKLIARENANFSGAASAKCTTSTANNDYSGAYNLANSDVICAAYFANAF